MGSLMVRGVVYGLSKCGGCGLWMYHLLQILKRGVWFIHAQGVNITCVYVGSALGQLLESVTEARKLEVENGHQWKQTKHLLKYIKNQEREITKTERWVWLGNKPWVWLRDEVWVWLMRYHCEWVW